MTRIERAIVINRPPEAVFEVLIDLDRLPDWATIVVETNDAPEPPIRTGSTFRQTIKVMGIPLESTWQVIELERSRHVAYEALALGGGRLALRQTIIPIGDGSRVEMEVDYDLPGGLLGDIADHVFVERHNEGEAERSLENLKRLVESTPALP